LKFFSKYSSRNHGVGELSFLIASYGKLIKEIIKNKEKRTRI